MPRIAWVQQADAARAVRADPDGMDVLALRALAGAPITQLAASGDGLLAAWRKATRRSSATSPRSRWRDWVSTSGPVQTYDEQRERR